MFVISRKPTWQNRDALAREDGLRRRRGGPVGALADELGLDAMRVVAVDRELHRCVCVRRLSYCMTLTRHETHLFLIR